MHNRHVKNRIRRKENRANRKKNRGGSGHGMAIVNTLKERGGGKIRLKT